MRERPITEIVYIKNKPMLYFVNSKNWDVELTSSGKRFNYIDTTEEFDPDDEYNSGSTIPYELTIQGIKSAERHQNEIGYWEIHQDNWWYFEAFHEDMIEQIYEKEEYPEYYL